MKGDVRPSPICQRCPIASGRRLRFAQRHRLATRLLDWNFKYAVAARVEHRLVLDKSICQPAEENADARSFNPGDVSKRTGYRLAQKMARSRRISRERRIMVRGWPFG